jgi:hypothetical protein
MTLKMAEQSADFANSQICGAENSKPLYMVFIWNKKGANSGKNTAFYPMPETCPVD